METVYRDYSPKGVKFYYVYKALAHPETNGYITPFTIEERLQHVQEAKKKLGTDITWLCDTMDNDVKHTMGDAPNSEFIIDPDGKIVAKRFWSDPDQLRLDLSELVGESEQVTKTSDLNMPRLRAPQKTVTGVVPRISAPGGLQPLIVEPVKSGDEEAPFYVKLRVEAAPDVIGEGKGQIYLGFFLDPIHAVHWNNQVDPPRYEITAADGQMIEPAGGTGPKVDVDADADPREFLLTVDLDPDAGPFEVTLHYFACDDAETFCLPVSQKYLVHLERDRDGGSRRSGGSGRGQRQPLRTPGGRARTPGPTFLRSLLAADSNEDGQITKDELPSRMAERILARYDTNENGKLDKEELDTIRSVIDDR